MHTQTLCTLSCNHITGWGNKQAGLRQGKAELRALAKKMLRGSQRSDLIEGAYHRYAFHDDHLPRWFSEDESRHMRYALAPFWLADMHSCLWPCRGCCSSSACLQAPILIA